MRTELWDTFIRNHKRFLGAHREMLLDKAHRSVLRAATWRIEEAVPTRYFHLCSGCGLLLTDSADRCPHCGGGSLVDLRADDAAHSVRELEDEARMVVPFWAGLRATTLAVVLSGGIFALGLTVVGVSASASGIRPYTDRLVSLFIVAVLFAVAAALFFTAHVYLPRLLAWRYFERHPSRPIRWRLPLPLWDDGLPTRERVRGQAGGTGEVLEAPFSGRPCLAYRAALLFDRPGDCRPPEWVLEESACAELRVEGRLLPAGRTTLDGALHPVDPTAVPEVSERLRSFFRARGLFQDDGDFWFFETLLTDGDRVTAHLPEEGAPHGPGVLVES